MSVTTTWRKEPLNLFFEPVISETDCSKEPNQNESHFQSLLLLPRILPSTQTATGSALRMRSAVLRAAFC